MPKKDKFENAVNKIKNSKFIKILILSSLLLTNKEFSVDLVAQKTPEPTNFNNVIRNTGIEIISKQSELNDVKILSDLIVDLKDDNHITDFVISFLAENGTHFKLIDNEAGSYGQYITGENIIEIDKNKMNKTGGTKDTIIHEGIHVLQDKSGITNDIYNLKPIDSIILLSLIELDAMIKSAQSFNPNLDLDKLLEKMTLSPIYFEHYINYGIQINTARINGGYVTNPTTTLENSLKKLNLQGWDDKYSNLNNLIKKIKQVIPEKQIKEMENLEDRYTVALARLNQNITMVK